MFLFKTSCRNLAVHRQYMYPNKIEWEALISSYAGMLMVRKQEKKIVKHGTCIEALNVFWMFLFINSTVYRQWRCYKSDFFLGSL